MQTNGKAKVPGKMISLCIVGLLVSAACTFGSGLNGEDPRYTVVSPVPPGDGAKRNSRGQEVFQGYCSFCHDIGHHTPSFGPSGTGLTADHLLLVLRQPPAGMPVIPLEDQDRTELVSYLNGVALEVFREQSNRP
jgi:mono/diheme cytochrome c family protein